MTPHDWYHKAVEKISAFLPGLDPNLEVELDTTVVTPNQGGEEYTTFVLVFSHSSNSNLQWTMEVEPNEDYIENELEQVVTNIYLQRIE